MYTHAVHITRLQDQTYPRPRAGGNPERPGAALAAPGPPPSRGSEVDVRTCSRQLLQQRVQRGAKLARAGGHADARRFHRCDLVVGAALAARDDRAGVAHAAAGRGGAAGVEPDGRLGSPAPGLVLEELRGFLLGAAADLADHDDALGLVIGEEQLEHVDEVGAVDRVATDPDRGGLAE